MRETIYTKYDRQAKVYVACYKTLDMVSQGRTKTEALLSLLDCIAIHIDFAIENENIENILPRPKIIPDDMIPTT